MNFDIVERSPEHPLASVFVARLADGAFIEFAESTTPPRSRAEKWVIIISTSRGCPIGCHLCDAGGDHRGPLSADIMLHQVDAAIRARMPDGIPRTTELKIQFARMGEPTLNPAVLEVLDELPRRYPRCRVVGSVSTVAPWGREAFLQALVERKRALYGNGAFQMQFSLHTTCETARRDIVPARTMPFARLGEWGARFHEAGDRKVTLNFAAISGLPMDPAALLSHFDPAHFLVKITPLNPTRRARAFGLSSRVHPDAAISAAPLVDAFRHAGYETLLSLGDPRENEIGSNCGLRVRAREKPEA